LGGLHGLGGVARLRLELQEAAGPPPQPLGRRVDVCVQPAPEAGVGGGHSLQTRASERHPHHAPTPPPPLPTSRQRRAISLHPHHFHCQPIVFLDGINTLREGQETRRAVIKAFLYVGIWGCALGKWGCVSAGRMGGAHLLLSGWVCWCWSPIERSEIKVCGPRTFR